MPHTKKLSWLCLALFLLVGCSVAPAVSPTPAEPAPIATDAQPVVHFIPTATQQDTLAPSPTPLPTAIDPTRMETPWPSTTAPTPAALPPEHYITNIRGHAQYFPLGCEAAAAKDWADYFGQDFNEFEFQFKLPQSDNPDFGFVGSVYSPWGQVPPYGYGVYAGPVADLLNAYGIQAEAHKGFTLEQLKSEIAADRPVIVWVIGNVVGGVPATYTDKEGRQATVAAYEHVVIVTGYNAGHVRYMNNGRFYEAPNDVFLNSWGVLGKMAVVR